MLNVLCLDFVKKMRGFKCIKLEVFIKLEF